MSDDIATLGLAVDSSGVVTASTNLDNLTASAGRTTEQISDFSKSLDQAVGDLQVLAAAQKNGTTLNDSATESLRGQRQVLSGITTDIALFGGGMGQAAQTAALLYVENAHLVEGWQGLKTAIGEIISPTTLVVAGMAAVGVAAYDVTAAIIAQEKAYDDLSSRSNTAISALHGIGSAAGFQGIDSKDFLSNMTGFEQATERANINVGSLATLLHANGLEAGTLQQNLLHVADLVANSSTEAEKYSIIQQAGLPATRQWVDFLSQGSANIQRASASAAQFSDDADRTLVNKARDFEDGWSKAWRNFEDSAQTAIINTAAKLDDLQKSGNLSRIARAIPVIGPAIGLGIDAYHAAYGSQTYQDQRAAGNSQRFAAGTTASDWLGNQNGGGNANSRKPTVDPEAERSTIELDQAHISALGQLASVEDEVKSREDSIALSRLGHVAITRSEESAILSYTAAQALGTAQIRVQTDAQNIEAQSIGMGVGATAAFRAEQERLAEFRQRGITLTAAQASALHDEAAALGQATQAAAQRRLQDDTDFNTLQLGRSDGDADAASALRSLYGDDYKSHLNDAVAGQIRLNDTLRDTKSAATGALTSFLQDLRDGKTGAVAFQDALTNLENKAFDIIANQEVSNIIGAGTKYLTNTFTPDGNTGTIGGTTGNLEAIHHGGYGPGDGFSSWRVVSPDAFVGAPRHHDGIGPGEHAAVIRDDESVLTPGQMSALAPVGRGGGSNTQVNITNYTGEQIQQSKRSDNGTDIVDIMVGQVGNRIAKGDPKITSALQARPNGHQPVARR
ncbi:MAG TPA: hypothetical protein VH206_14315 [Xanthobacteraceae bacterium]|jgi:hypothetical protein|nr:hypothetical protein [Xanthobacteraceae bacterium]